MGQDGLRFFEVDGLIEEAAQAGGIAPAPSDEVSEVSQHLQMGPTLRSLALEAPPVRFESCLQHETMKRCEHLIDSLAITQEGRV